VLQAATGRPPGEGLRSNRGWSADEWSAAALAVRGLVDDGADEPIALLRPLADVVMKAGAVPAHNNMGVHGPTLTSCRLD